MLNLCDRFHCLPSQLMQEDAELIRMIVIQERGTRRKPEPQEEEG